MIVQGYLSRLAGLSAPPEGEQQVNMALERLEALAEEAKSAPVNPFTTWTESSFRLETLPQYLVDQEEAAFAAFCERGAVPPLSPETSAWYDRLRQEAREGRRRGRVHVVSRPLNAYIEFALALYPWNVEAGEDVRIADRGEHPELAALTEDWYLYDLGTDHVAVVLMDYDAAGHWLGWRWTRDPAVIEDCRRQRELALAASVPFTEYVTKYVPKVPAEAR